MQGQISRSSDALAAAFTSCSLVLVLDVYYSSDDLMHRLPLQMRRSRVTGTSDADKHYCHAVWFRDAVDTLPIDEELCRRIRHKQETLEKSRVSPPLGTQKYDEEQSPKQWRNSKTRATP